MDYYKYDFKTGSSDNDILIALLSIQPFDTFVENENGFEAYLPAEAYDPSIEGSIEELKTTQSFDYQKELIKGENWNEAWESNFHPIQVGAFCGIRAEFHQPIPDVEYELVITPKMAFGTGHHETTFMVIQLMKEVDFSHKVVLDYGCGTGVLAILASKLGAEKIDAIDIEEASWQNIVENCETNAIKNVNAYKGELSLVESKRYGVVLANINRNVILDSLPTLFNMIEPYGVLIVSGILKSDVPILKNGLMAVGFKYEKIIEKNKWIAMRCQR